MKRVVYFWFCFFLLSLCSCKESPYPHYLLLADSLTMTYPDSAVALLKAVKGDIPYQSEATQRYYQLLCVKADVKSAIPLTSDSLIQEVLRYYRDEGGDERLLHEAYYFAGCACRDLGDSPQALDYYYKALTAMPRPLDYRMVSLIHSQMGGIFEIQAQMEKARESFVTAYRYSRQERDSVSMIYDLRDIASTFLELNVLDSALIYFQKSYGVAEALQNRRMMGMLQGQIARVYKKTGDFDLAKRALEKNFAVIDKRSIAIYSIASDLYYKMGEMDSATYYYNKVLEVGTMRAKTAAHWGLANIALKRGKPLEAIEHIGKYMTGVDSIWAETDNESIHRVNSLYNYSLRERENFRLKEENSQKQLYFYCVLIGLWALALCFFIYYHYSCLKRENLQLQLRQLKEEQQQRSPQYIEEKRKEQALLEESLHDDSLSEAAKEQLLRKKEQLYYVGKTVELEVENRRVARQTLLNSDICRYFGDCIAKGESVRDTSTKWMELEKEVNAAYEGFTERLMAIRKMSKHEVHLCLLIKIEVSPRDMAVLTDHSKESVTSGRRRLYEKFFSERGTPQQWDDFLLSL